MERKAGNLWGNGGYVSGIMGMNANSIIGSVIKDTRERNGISQDTLCRGLCSRAFLARVEAGERECEKILTDAFLQRAGVAADRFSYMADPEEQVVLICREKMYDAVEKNNVAWAKKAFIKYKKLTAQKNKLHGQILLYYQAVLDWQNKKPMDGIMEMLDEAWEISHPGEPLFENDGKVLSLTELSIAMMRARAIEDSGDVQTAKHCYESLLQYMDKLFEQRDAARIYPQIAYRLTNIYLQSGHTGEALALAQRMIRLLREQARMSYIRFFLSIVEKYGDLSPSEKDFVGKACEEIRWLYERFAVEEWRWEWDVSFSMSEYFLCGKTIRARRETLGMSQEELADGICDPVTISRIECGRVAPKRKNFVALMQKVGLTGCGYDTQLPIRSLPVLRVATKIKLLLNQEKSKEAEPVIEQLDTMLENPNKHEKQFLLNAKATAQGNMKLISWEQRRDMQAEALHLTTPTLPLDKLEKWFFSEGEMGCMLSLAHAEDRLGNREPYIKLLYAIKEQYELNFLGVQHYARHYEGVCRELGDILGNNEEYEEGIRIEINGIRCALKANSEPILSTMLYDCGWNMEHLWRFGIYSREESLQYMETSYNLKRLFGAINESEFIRSHIEKIYS